jgi:hypothetical protein
MGQHVGCEIWLGLSTTQPEEPCLAQHEPTGHAWAIAPARWVAREAGGPLWHDGRHDPLVVRSIKGTTQPAWSIIVVMYNYYYGYVSNIIVVIYQVFKYYDHHILLVQKFL